MPQTWKSKEGPDETCSKCGSVYAVTISRLPASEPDAYYCEVCKHLIRQWNGTESYGYVLKVVGTRQ